MSNTPFKAEFEMLRSPHESQLQELRDKYGYAPEAAEEVARKRAAQEEELAQQMIADPSLKRKLDNIVTARYLYWELYRSTHTRASKSGHDHSRLSRTRTRRHHAICT